MASPWGKTRAERAEEVARPANIEQPALHIPDPDPDPDPDPEPEPTSRVCKTCGRDLPLSEFHRMGARWHRAVCRACYSKSSLATRDPRRAHNAHLRRTYGITLDRYEAMLAAQGGVCAICGDAPGQRRFHVDHDHKTGQVRAILCNGCNTGIGGFRDDPDLLERAAKYLREHCVEDAWTLAP